MKNKSIAKRHNLIRSIAVLLVGWSMLTPLAAPSVFAANIWDGGGADNLTTTANNWDNNAVPGGGVTLTFAGSVQPTVVWNGINSVAPVNISGFTFASGASAFTINVGTQPNVQFVSGGTPLLNSSSNLQTVNILSGIFFNSIKTFNAGTAGFALNGGIDLRWDGLTSGQTNTLNLIGTADSTTAFISQTGTQAVGALNAVTKSGTGKWTVTGNATYNGATTISGGALEYRGSISSSGITNNSALIFNNAANQSYGNAIGGSGTLTKQGAGIFTLTGSNSYSGATTITGGTLSVASIANGGLPSGIGQSGAGAANLVFDGGTLRYTGGTFASNRAFTINNTKTATIEVTNGVSNLSLVGATGAATTGALTKIGDGTLTLTGINTYTGTTTVSAGKLVIDGNNSAATGIVTVANMATLGGGGTVGGATTIDTGGIVSPGNSIGTLSFSGNLTINGTYVVETASFQQADLLDVNGILSLGMASALDLDSMSSLVPTETYVIADYTGGSLSGFFSSVDSSITATHSVAYGYNSGTQIALIPIPEPSTLVLGGLGILGFAGLRLRRRR